MARFDLTGWGIPESKFRRDVEGKVIKLGKQTGLSQLGSAVPEIQADIAGLIYTVDTIYTEISWNNRLALLGRDVQQPPED